MSKLYNKNGRKYEIKFMIIQMECWGMGVRIVLYLVYVFIFIEYMYYVIGISVVLYC